MKVDDNDTFCLNIVSLTIRKMCVSKSQAISYDVIGSFVRP